MAGKLVAGCAKMPMLKVNNSISIVSRLAMVSPRNRNLKGKSRHPQYLVTNHTKAFHPCVVCLSDIGCFVAHALPGPRLRQFSRQRGLREFPEREPRQNCRMDRKPLTQRLDVGFLRHPAGLNQNLTG